MSRRQKGKGHKRAKNWHRGRTEADRWHATNLPTVNSGADTTTGTPRPLRQQPRSAATRRGEAL